MRLYRVALDRYEGAYGMLDVAALGVAQSLADATRDGIAEALRPFAGADEIRRLSRHLVAVLQGTSIQVRDGATPKEMQEIVDDVVAGIEARYGRARRKW